MSALGPTAAPPAPAPLAAAAAASAAPAAAQDVDKLAWGVLQRFAAASQYSRLEDIPQFSSNGKYGNRATYHQYHGVIRIDFEGISSEGKITTSDIVRLTDLIFGVKSPEHENFLLELTFDKDGWLGSGCTIQGEDRIELTEDGKAGTNRPRARRMTLLQFFAEFPGFQAHTTDASIAKK